MSRFDEYKTHKNISSTWSKFALLSNYIPINIYKKIFNLRSIIKKTRNSLKFYQNYRNCGPRNIHSSKSWIYIKIHLYKTTSKSNYI